MKPIQHPLKNQESGSRPNAGGSCANPLSPVDFNQRPNLWSDGNCRGRKLADGKILSMVVQELPTVMSWCGVAQEHASLAFLACEGCVTEWVDVIG